MAFILDDIILAPVKLTKWLGEKVYEASEAELTDKSRIQEALLEAQIRFELGEMTEEEYNARETVLVERLEAIRQYEEDEDRAS